MIQNILITNLNFFSPLPQSLQCYCFHGIDALLNKKITSWVYSIFIANAIELMRYDRLWAVGNCMAMDSHGLRGLQMLWWAINGFGLERIV